jgi:hypothetical protein
MNETDRLKNKLIALFQEIIPGVPTAEEIRVFMKTGKIPPNWLIEMFERDIPSEKTGKIYDLMDFIHMDLSGSTENKRRKEPEDKSIKKSNARRAALVAKTDIGSLSAELSKKTDNKHALAIVEKSTNKPRKVPHKPASETSSNQPKSGSRRWGNFPKKENLSEQELAEILLLRFVDSAFSGKNTLDLSELQTLVSQSLIGHTTRYDYQKKVLTLYNDMGNAVANFDAKKVKVVLA